ncbi:MAG: hypothetical protein HC774_04735, partial [Sphingomonadales bacterium]|nr:hypothetical protein [Sphingomonadales bacterium]
MFEELTEPVGSEATACRKDWIENGLWQRARDALAFKEKLRKIDILLIDDMEFLQGPTIQQEFCHTLNSLIDGGRQVVVAADRARPRYDKLDMRMRSRLGGGLVAESADR